MQQPGSTLDGFDPSLRDATIDPCTDFYQYACGGWLKANPIPADQASYGRDTEAREAAQQVLRQILEKDAAGGAARTADEQKLGDAYAACMDTEAIDAAGFKPLQPLLDAIDAVAGKEELPALLAKLHAVGVQAFFFFGAQVDFRNARQQIAEFAEPRLGLPEKGFYERTDGRSAELREQYRQHLHRTFLLLGEPEQQATADASAVLKLETALAAASLSQQETRDPATLYHKSPLVQFEANSPGLAVSTYLKAAGAPAVQVLNVAEPVYFLELEDQLNTTSLANIKAFLRWSLVRAVEPTALPQLLEDEDFSFYGKELASTPQQQPRWQRCVQTVGHELGGALDDAYVAERVSPADKARSGALTRALEAAANHEIDTLDWMSPATKAEAHRKLHLIATDVGSAKQRRDDATLVMDRADAFGNAERAEAFRVARDVSRIGRPVDRGAWELTAWPVTASYDPQRNSLNLPPALLQPPYLDPSQDDAVNDGAAGGMIGQALAHSFDDQGRQFDAEGNLHDWWRKEDAKQFAERLNCVAGGPGGSAASGDLHGDAKPPFVDDLAALRLAFLAWQAGAGSPGAAPPAAAEPASGGLTPAQQVFAAYAQSRCDSTRSQAVPQWVPLAARADEKSRVNGAVTQLPAFADAFACKANAPMVATRHCALW